MSTPTLQFIGCGDAFGTGGRLNTCFHVTHCGGSFLIDCGASSLIGLHKQQIDANSIDTVYISHLHGDHFAGLVFFLMEARYVKQRQQPLTIIGPEGIEQRLIQASDALYPNCWSAVDDLPFPLTFHEWTAEQALIHNGVTATPFEAHHLQDGNDFILRFEVEQKIVTYSGDTGWTEQIRPATDQADLFITECFFKDPCCDFHLDYATVCTERESLTAKEIILTHLGPDIIHHRDELLYPVAYDGLKISL